MKFKKDIYSLGVPEKQIINFKKSKLPTNTGLYFRAKQREIVDQYSAARLFLNQIYENDWAHWFTETSDTKNNEILKLKFSALFYETALIYYNILVDLSWTICYITAEYMCKIGDQYVEFSGIKTIEEAYLLLRKAEDLVTNPTSESNPFIYLKTMCPQYKNVIDLIIEFWKKFSNSNIRKNYNYLKHKGKPSYTEIEKLLGPCSLDIFFQVNNDNGRVQIASDTHDVRYKISLCESIDELYTFDDEKLFPYLADVLKQLEELVKPSSMIIS